MRIPSSSTVSRRFFLQISTALGIAGCAPTKVRQTPRVVATPTGKAMSQSPPPAPSGNNNFVSKAPPAPLLKRALFAGAGLHPSKPQLASASQVWEADGGGQLVVWDLLQGQRINTYTDQDEGFVFDGGPGLVRWAPNGDRVAAAFATSGIFVLEHGEPQILFFSDDARDNPVRFCWLNDAAHLYTDVGEIGRVPRRALGEHKGPYKRVFSGRDPLLTPLPNHLRGLSSHFHYNAAIAAVIVIHPDGRFIEAIDVVQKKSLYKMPVLHSRPNRKDVDAFSLYLRDAAWSADGRRLAIPWAHIVRFPGGRLRSQEAGVVIFDGDTGKQRANVVLSKTFPERVESISWGPTADGRYRLAVVMSKGAASHRLQLLVDERPAWSEEVHLARGNFDVRDARRLAWSPHGDALALAWHDGDIRVLDAANGKRRASMATRIKPSNKPHHRGKTVMGVLWGQGERLVVLCEDSISFMTTAGELVAHHDVPMA